MKISGKRRVIFINMLIAAAISLIVNFSYFIFTIMSPLQPQGGFRGGGIGGAGGRDTWMMAENHRQFIWLLVIYWAVFAFILLWVVTARIDQRNPRGQFIERIVWCVAITVVFYLLAPGYSRGKITILAATGRFINPMLLLKSSFTVVVTVLYGKIFELVYQKQQINIENEQLKSENLLTRYNMLISQINPHFLFNSLNSLSMLVREQHNDKALTYIDRLSDTFRYVIQNGQNELTSLDGELEFLSGYKYLHEVRYAGKLFFDIGIADRYRSWRLPALSLQPLVENAVKHNSITLARPFHITIRTGDGELIVSNPLIPKLEPEDSTGTGLQNLSSRSLLLTGKSITVKRTSDTFSVHLPLLPPDKP